MPTHDARSAMLYRQAVERHRAGDLDGAARLCGQILSLQPGHFDALHMLGACRAQQRRYPEALEMLSAAVRADPRSAAALANCANVLSTLGRWPEALECHDRSLALVPDNPITLNYRGMVLRKLGRAAEAVQSYDRALAARPGYAEALSNRAAALHDLGRFDEALASSQAALAHNPRNAASLNNRGIILLKLQQPGEALESFDAALALRPRDAEILTNRGIALRELSREPDALENFEAALAADPAYAEAGWNKALSLLAMGDYVQGWRHYEWRKQRNAPAGALPYSAPWSGAEEIAGKTLFIYAEQGMGDTIQFFRFLAPLAARGAHVIVSAQNGLVQLLRDSGLAVDVIAQDAAPPPFDYHLPWMSLPLALGQGGDLLADTVPYLRARPERVARWAARIGRHGRKIGIAWQGAVTGAPGRSLPLACFRALADVPDLRLISLQKGFGTEQLAGAGVAVESLGADFDAGPDAFLDTAAVMENLDLMITLDSAVPHLAGALGRPTWVALKKVPDWRWGLRGETTPWYPGMRLFRQTHPGDWEPVFAAIRQALQQT